MFPRSFWTSAKGPQQLCRRTADHPSVLLAFCCGQTATYSEYPVSGVQNWCLLASKMFAGSVGLGVHEHRVFHVSDYCTGIYCLLKPPLWPGSHESCVNRCVQSKKACSSTTSLLFVSVSKFCSDISTKFFLAILQQRQVKYVCSPKNKIKL